MSFLYENFNKQKLLNFLINIDIKKPNVPNLMYFEDKMVHLFFLQKDALINENVKLSNSE